MDLPQFLNRKTFGNERPRAPRALLYIPPHCSAVHCPDVESAQSAAESYAAESPGRTVAVYQLIGYAFRPIERPAFTPAESDKAKAELLDVAPSTIELGDPIGDDGLGRPDLSSEQQETLRRIRSVMAQPEPDSE